jgi:hypothetical protein
MCQGGVPEDTMEAEELGRQLLGAEVAWIH